jgi:Ca2+-binding EF-hand superfamily protein
MPASALVDSPSAETTIATVAAKSEPTAAVPPPDVIAPTAAAANKPAATVEDESGPEAKPAAERIAILTPGGPLLVDVRISVGGEPLTKFHEALVRRVLEVGDSDHDGRSTWKELVADRTYLEKELPNAPAADSRQMKSLIERYDENGDGEIQLTEAAAWLGRDSGVSAKPLAVRSTRAYRPAPRTTSQVWHLIDRDDDSRLTRDEIGGAASRLLALDADDDRILAPAEMASLREQLAASGQRRMYVPREANHYAVMHMEADLDVERLHYLLSDLYAPQQDLGPNSFSDLSSAYKKLDADGDGWFDGGELATMRTVDPHLELNIAFEAPAKEKPGGAAIEAKTLTPEVTAVGRPAADRAVISVGNTRLIVSAHRLPDNSQGEPKSGQAAPSQVRLMVHDESDALFETLDVNADGRLGEREIAFSSQRLAERDRDGDGDLSGDEFPYSMIVAFLLGEQTSERSFYVPASNVVKAANSEERLPAWFAHADLNSDGDVSRREFLGSTAQFERLDQNQDGYIGPGEAGM